VAFVNRFVYPVPWVIFGPFTAATQIRRSEALVVVRDEVANEVLVPVPVCVAPSWVLLTPEYSIAPQMIPVPPLGVDILVIVFTPAPAAAILKHPYRYAIKTALDVVLASNV